MSIKIQQNLLSENVLKRGLGLKEAITITVGTVVGVGLFTVGANAVGWLGSTIILATLTALLVSIYPALLYAEMGSSLPFAGGTYNFATHSLGRPLGVLAGWNFVISLIAVASGEALAFSNYFKWLLEGLGFSLVLDERIIAALLIFVFIYINYRGIEIAGKWQNAFVFFFWGAALVWFIIMFPKIDLNQYIPFATPSDTNWREFIMVTSLVWWCFAGFETAVAMGEEIRYPQINIPRALFLAPFIIFIVTAIFQWFLVGFLPVGEYEMIKNSAAPYAEGMKAAGIMGIPFILLCIGIAFGGDLSTINPSIGAPSRYLYTMSRDGSLPGFFAKLHPQYQTPYIAIIFMGIITLFLITTGSIIYIASLSLFADLFYYIVGFIASIALRIKRPDLERPFKAPAAIFGAVISIIIYLVMMSQLPKDGVITGIIWCIFGLLFYFIWSQTEAGRNALAKGNKIKINQKSPELPSAKIKAKLDKEFKIWRNIVAFLFIFALSLYVLPHIF